MARREVPSERGSERRSEQPWSVPLALHEVPETGRHVELSADEHVRDAIARVAGLRSVSRLDASFDVTRGGRDRLHVVGAVSATVGQTCVVTLEPIASEIDEEIDVVFAPPASLPPRDVAEADAEIAAPDGPEPLIDGVVDLGALATEFLILAIDPYPRRPGAVFDAPPVGDSAPRPFAALAALKKKGERGEQG